MAISNIKTRILVFVVFFELIAYSTIQLFNHYSYKNELLQLNNQAIEQTFAASIAKINNLTRLMERNVIDLAIAGENLFLLKKQQQLAMEVIEARVEDILVNNFSNFPEAIGGGIWYEPYIFDKAVRYFGPYAYQGRLKVEFSWELNTPEYDYHHQDWYTQASRHGWGREQKRVKPIFWTPPYYDDAGSYSLMMTVDAVMYDHEQKEIGLATVDWSLKELTGFLESVRVSVNSFPFLIHVQSEQFLSYPKAPGLVMQSARQLPWGRQVLADKQSGQFSTLASQVIDKVLYNIYFYRTQDGFIFGSLSPVSDMEQEVNNITTVTLLAGTAIGAGFIIMMIVLIRFLFSPFDKVLALIKHSITHKSHGEGVVIKPIHYPQTNEFTPIIKALDDVYHQITAYMSEIVESNEQLSRSKKEVYQLNEALEDKVRLRTQQLAIKTEEALLSLEQLKSTQQQLIEQEKHAGLGRLVAGVAHEINTPLGIAVTAASNMEEGIHQVYHDLEAGKLSKSDFALSKQLLAENATLLLANLKRASNLIANFKQVAADQASDEFCCFNLANYINKIISSLSPKISHSHHNIRFECSKKDLEIYSIPGVLVQIITNIVDNALEHAFSTEQAGNITVNVSEAGENILLQITDDGIGMSGETAALIFDPFFTTSRKSGSCGLGMHIVYNLITQQLKGRIECRSAPGQGSSFLITLPKGSDSPSSSSS
ncbi:ATP-binding protein [Thalassomonas actiniarum]|uniref:histidine kinase n=1 Tax=Thalassomonas actiniarum TaxID=485447 RepID=A0AAE9YRZ3_9GAMM|nr:ATP-binding protein [Thalassomonas actiniarum]WDD99358.1 GHKL domain-containing protein [Thalassomonas actiniarum]